MVDGKKRQPDIVDGKNNEDGDGWTVDHLVVKLQGAVSQLPVNLHLVPMASGHLMVAIEITMMWTRKKVTNLVRREERHLFLTTQYCGPTASVKTELKPFPPEHCVLNIN